MRCFFPTDLSSVLLTLAHSVNVGTLSLGLSSYLSFVSGPINDCSSSAMIHSLRRSYACTLGLGQYFLVRTSSEDRPSRRFWRGWAAFGQLARGDTAHRLDFSSCPFAVPPSLSLTSFATVSRKPWPLHHPPLLNGSNTPFRLLISSPSSEHYQSVSALATLPGPHLASDPTQRHGGAPTHRHTSSPRFCTKPITSSTTPSRSARSATYSRATATSTSRRTTARASSSPPAASSVPEAVAVAAPGGT